MAIVNSNSLPSSVQTQKVLIAGVPEASPSPSPSPEPKPEQVLQGKDVIGHLIGQMGRPVWTKDEDWQGNKIQQEFQKLQQDVLSGTVKMTKEAVQSAQKFLNFVKNSAVQLSETAKQKINEAQQAITASMKEPTNTDLQKAAGLAVLAVIICVGPILIFAQAPGAKDTSLA